MSCCHSAGTNINININNFNGGGGRGPIGRQQGFGQPGMHGAQRGGNPLQALARKLADPLGILPKGLNPVDVATNPKNPLNPLQMLNPLSPLKALGLFG